MRFMEKRGNYCGYRCDSSSSAQMLRELRRKSCLTQEKAAYGICSVQKYSRIEAGKDIPSEIEFISLMSRLGDPGLSYQDLYTPENSERLSLRTRIHEEALLDNWETLSECLCRYYSLFPVLSPEEKQLLGFYEAILCYFQSDFMNGTQLCELCMDLISAQRPDFSSSSDIGFIPTQTEFLLINALSVGLSDSGDPSLENEAIGLLHTLLLLNMKRSLPVIMRRTNIGILINLCNLEIEMGELYKAKEHLSLLFTNISYSGGSRLYYLALMCKADLLDRTGNPEAACELRHSASLIFHKNSRKSAHKVLVF